MWSYDLSLILIFWLISINFLFFAKLYSSSKDIRL